uniref:Uncharacterized protein n=1 Tax=Periophthalmus magnuspinnatus TaxID=409849 RepID=A0A3B4ANA3_9GOBI
MLRSTGFFRGIDCPFYTDYSEGKGGKNGCNRPYCHFRHSQHRLLSYGAAEEQGYDPFNPEVVHPPEPQNEQAASGDINGALALVNRAIEEVRTQMEREKRKLSRIGDEPYDPSDNASLESTKPNTSHMTYDPGSYQMTSGDYNPSPGCSKYTLDTTTEEKNANSMEYVPTLMKKSTARTQNLSTSTKSKYTLDNTKPSTDMEYDPLSNYSASIAGKSKKEEVVSGKTDGNKSSRVQISTEEYVVSVKKTPPASIDTKKYTISDSDGESSGTEYKPTSITNLQLKKDSSRTDIDVDWNKAKTRKECLAPKYNRFCSHDDIIF